MKAIIFDVDGTIADCSHRLHFLDKKDWKSFFENLSDDAPIMGVIHILRAMYSASGYRVLIVTARPDDADYKANTIAWLDKHHIPRDAIYTRKAGDYRKDSIVKEEILDQIIADGYDPQIAIDDRPQVVEMWRRRGIKTLQCDHKERDTRIGWNGEQHLTLLVGPSGAGKSTFAKAAFPAYQTVSSDQIREDMQYNHTTDQPIVWAYIHDLIETRLKHGVKTVLDATNIKRAGRMSILERVPQGQTVKYIVMDRSLEDKLIGKIEHVVRRHHQVFQSSKKFIMDGDGMPNVTVEIANVPGNILLG